MTSDDIVRLARELRQRQTQAESFVWNMLRAKRLCNKKFRRQHPVPPFIADFACHELMLIVEIDGGYHDYLYDGDVDRQKYLESKGWRVVRYSNEEVIDDAEAVAIAIAKEMGLQPSFRQRGKIESGMRSKQKARGPSQASM